MISLVVAPELLPVNVKLIEYGAPSITNDSVSELLGAVCRSHRAITSTNPVEVLKTTRDSSNPWSQRSCNITKTFESVMGPSVACSVLYTKQPFEKLKVYLVNMKIPGFGLTLQSTIILGITTEVQLGDI